jgi:hypothetical protein
MYTNIKNIMAIITTYPLGIPETGDYLTGSKMTTVGGQINPTKNFTVGSVIKAGFGYTVYTALVSQTGSAAPVATMLKNDTGYTYTWARTAPGTYTITASGNAFTSNKTIVFYNLGEYAASSRYPWVRTSDTIITLPLGGDGRITNGAFEIRVYS